MRILEPADQQRMESHLARCRMCRDELAEMERSLQLLAFSIDEVEPAPDAKQNLIARFETERDRPKVSPPLPIPAHAPATSQEKKKPASRSSRLLPWSYGSIFAGLAVALLVIGVWNFMPFDDPDSNMPGGQIELMAMELTCTDCQNDTGGHIGADPGEKDGLVIAWNLDPQRKHEVWCVKPDGTHTKVGDLNVAESGSVMQKVSFPDAVGGYEQIYVSRDDGTQELSVAPGISVEGDEDSSTDPAAPAE